MILEVAHIVVSNGKKEAFEDALKKAKQVLIRADGYISHEFKRCVEEDSKYILLINWESLEAHTEGFRKSELFKEWRALIGSFFAESPQVYHYHSI